MKVGDPSDPQTEIGPLINARQARAFAAQLERGIDEGARVALRGKVEGNVASPTVFADVRSDMWLAQNELFGPAVCVMPFDTPEEAIRIANVGRNSRRKSIPEWFTSTTEPSMTNRLWLSVVRRPRAWGV